MGSVTIDALDRRIIHALYVDGRAPFNRMAEVLGTSEQTVARRYRRLRDEHGIRVVGQLDSQRLGRSDWAVRVRCTPDSAMAVATALARRQDTAWVQLTSGGTEIFCMMSGQDEERRTALLLDQLPASSRIIDVQAHWLLHVFGSDGASAPGAVGLSRAEVRRLERCRERSGPSNGGTAGALAEGDWPLLRALAEDGRTTNRELAARTRRHESTVRRRVDELVAAGVLGFDLDVDSDLLGLKSRALLWLSVVPAALMAAGAALAQRRAVPFVAATTGGTNLLAIVVCQDQAALTAFLTREVAGLEGVSRVETSPVIRSVKMHATLTRSR